jgi:phosphoribosylglycinamide formyltransferase-1
MAKKKVAILISGRGSNMAALIDAAHAPDYPAEIALVLSNRPEALGLTIAREADIPTQAISHKVFETRASFDAVVDVALSTRNVDFVCLAGFMRIFTDAFVEKWRGKMLNIHPSLLPSFKGSRVLQESHAAGLAISGCTVHFVVPELDAGPIVGQAAVPVLANDTVDTMAERILGAEHKLYPACLRLLCEGKVALQGSRAAFAGSTPPALWIAGS